jgi:hypothetical protein
MMPAPVKDYQMPADQQGLADCIIVWGRRQIILRGGNRGVVAQDSVLLPCYGDCKLALGWRWVRMVQDALVCSVRKSVFSRLSRISLVPGVWSSVDLVAWPGVGQSVAVTVRWRQFSGVCKV